MKRLPKLPHQDFTVEIMEDESRDLSDIDPRMSGVDVPTQLTRFDDYTKERWLICIEVMVSRGIELTSEISSITGLSARTAGMLKKEVLARWAGTVTRGALNARREKLYIEADRVKAELWKMYERGERVGADFREQLSYLKMIVDTGARQAKLCGLEALPSEVR